MGVGSWSYARAIATIVSHRYPLEAMHTHTMPLDRVEEAIQILAGDVPGEDAIHITIKV